MGVFGILLLKCLLVSLNFIVRSSGLKIRNFNFNQKTRLFSTVGSQNLDWPSLGFEYRQTNCFVKCVYRQGSWGNIEVQDDPYIPIHIGATALHYGQACFEGLKAFHCKDGTVKLFRPEENAMRIAMSSERICMPLLPPEKFIEAVKLVVSKNADFIPPYGTGGALYIRPLLFGSGPRIGLQPADEYTFICMVLPVADYYKGGLSKPVSALVISDYDRAAPRGVGNAKVAGNYAADLLPNQKAKKEGFPIGLYLDAKTNSFVEEFSTSNFFAVAKNSAEYVTPKSNTILKSVTNKSLMDLARDEGLEISQRAIPIEELMGGGFSEVGACGTAVVLTPVGRVTYQDKTVAIGDPDVVGPVLSKLYKRVRAVQTGEEEDKFGWMTTV